MRDNSIRLRRGKVGALFKNGLRPGSAPWTVGPGASGLLLKPPSPHLVCAASCGCCSSDCTQSDSVGRRESKISTGLPPASHDSVWLPGCHAYTCSRISIPASLAFMPPPAILSNGSLNGKITCVWHRIKWLTPVPPSRAQPGKSVSYPFQLWGLDSD